MTMAVGLCSTVEASVSEPQDPFASENSRAMMDWLLLDSPVPLTVYDTALRCVWQNTAMCHLIGMPLRERRGRQIGDVLVSMDVTPWEECLRQVTVSGAVVEDFVIRGRTPADPDHDHTFSAAASPLRSGEGRILGVCATVHDVTEQYASRERLALVNDASTRIGTTLDLRATAQELADVAVPRLADFVSVDLLEPLLHGDEPEPFTRGAVLRRMAHQSRHEGVPEAMADIGGIDSYPGGSPPARCLAAGRSLLLRGRDASVSAWFTDDPVRAEKASRYGFHSWLLVPVQAREVTLGVTVFCRSLPSEPFETEDLVLAEELVTRAAISLDNSRRFTRERTAAVALQHSLLPQELPRHPGLDAACRYLPAGSRFGAGGDWFDVIPLSGARVALVVGDAVGHGLHASVAMGRLRTAVRALAEVDLPPDELLTHLDDLVTHLDTGNAGDRGEHPFAELWATCMYGVYDPISRTWSLACAGHPPPVVVTPDGTTAPVEVSPGPPLGLGGLPFELCEVTLPEGSELVLYTDGLLASRDQDVDARLDRLTRELARPAASPEARCDDVLDAMLPALPADDVALLVARTRALHAEQVALLEVTDDPAVVADARSWATRRLTAWGLAEMSQVTELVVSELVTNAMRHGAPPIQLRLIKNTALICEVADSSSTSPHLRRARSLDEGGRGLLLVAQLTQRWGTRHGREGKTIWCEQRLTG
jgi:serine phosphatase RsbU (regulator of sigma subunit)